MLPIPEYWQAIARAIDAEEAQASIFVRHNAAVGAAREAILKDVLSRLTLEPFRITSGFVFHAPSEKWCSRQCDVIIYNPMVARPYYAIGEIAVVPREAAKLVIEVKTDLDGEEFEKMLNIWESVFWLPVPMLGFAYDGVQFQTFVEYLRAAIPTAPRGLPTCICVHKKITSTLDTIIQLQRTMPCQTRGGPPNASSLSILELLAREKVLQRPCCSISTIYS